MEKYTIKFMPEYKDTSLWSVSNNAYESFGNTIDYNKVGLSSELIKELKKFDDSILGLIDWDNPGGESPLNSEERKAIWNKGQLLLEDIRNELGDDYNVVDKSDWIK